MNVDGFDWVAVFLENVETRQKLKVIPDDIGVVIRHDGKYNLIKSCGERTELNLDLLSIEDLSENHMSCQTVFLDEEGDNILGLTLGPLYKGNVMGIAGHGGRRYEWFCEWLDKEL